MRARWLAWLTLMLFAGDGMAKPPVPPPHLEVPGKHFTLTEGSLFVPDFYRLPENKKADVVLFFLGASWCAEQNFYAAKKNGVIFTANEKTRKAVELKNVTGEQLLSSVLAALNKEGIVADGAGRICVASFSGGYSSVRSVLSATNFVDKITDVVLADSLYAPRAAHNTNELDPAAMSPFLNYARRAAEGRGRFIFSQLFPPEEIYRSNTTTLAANYLIGHLQLERKPAHGKTSAGAEILYHADKNGLHILGYAGMTTQDHFNHFYGISDLFKETSFENVPAKQ